MSTAYSPALTVPEAAELLAIPMSTAYEFAARGKLPGAYRIGSRVRIDRETLLRWITEQAAKPLAPR